MITRPKYRKVVFVSDLHCPFMDTKAINCLLSFMSWWQPDTIIFLGDVIDFYAISSFTKDPERALKLQDEIDSANYVLDCICNYSNDIYYIKGNHEARLQKYIWNKAQEINIDSIRLPSLLRFKERGIKYIEQGKFNYHGLILKHGSVVRKFAGYTAKAEFEKNGLSGVSAHTHRASLYYQANESGSYAWMECGCLCRLDAEYLEGEVPNWQQSFGIGYLKEKSDRFHLELIPIVNGKAIYVGMEFV